MDGPCAQRAAIAARLADQLGVDCFTGDYLPREQIWEGHSCVIAANGEVPCASGGLRVFLHDGDEAHSFPAGYHLCLNAQVLGAKGSTELLKQFVVQRLMLRRESSRRV